MPQVTVIQDPEHPLHRAVREGVDAAAANCDDNFAPGESRHGLQTERDRVELHYLLRPGRVMLFVWYGITWRDALAAIKRPT